MGLRLYTAPATEPVTLAQAKAQLRLETDADDTYVTDLIAAARTYFERATGRSLITQTWDLTLDDFPPNGTSAGLIEYPFLEDSSWSMPFEFYGGGSLILLPMGYVTGITSLTYLDSSGVSTVLASSGYRLDTSQSIGRLTPSYGNVWPTTRGDIASVVVRYTTGYGAAAAVPADIVHVIKMLITFWYDGDRSAVLESRVTHPVEHALEAVISSYRILTAKGV